MNIIISVKPQLKYNNVEHTIDRQVRLLSAMKLYTCIHVRV